jgi:IS1 transposase
MGMIPPAQHKAITEHTRKTNDIGRFNNTLRQRVSRLVRNTLAFSKRIENHISASRYFICHSLEHEQQGEWIGMSVHYSWNPDAKNRKKDDHD